MESGCSCDLHDVQARRGSVSKPTLSRKISAVSDQGSQPSPPGVQLNRQLGRDSSVNSSSPLMTAQAYRQLRRSSIRESSPPGRVHKAQPPDAAQHGTKQDTPECKTKLNQQQATNCSPCGTAVSQQEADALSETLHKFTFGQPCSPSPDKHGRDGEDTHSSSKSAPERKEDTKSSHTLSKHSAKSTAIQEGDRNSISLSSPVLDPLSLKNVPAMDPMLRSKEWTKNLSLDVDDVQEVRNSVDFSPAHYVEPQRLPSITVQEPSPVLPTPAERCTAEALQTSSPEANVELSSQEIMWKAKALEFQEQIQQASENLQAYADKADLLQRKNVDQSRQLEKAHLKITQLQQQLKNAGSKDPLSTSGVVTVNLERTSAAPVSPIVWPYTTSVGALGNVLVSKGSMSSAHLSSMQPAPGHTFPTPAATHVPGVRSMWDSQPSTSHSFITVPKNAHLQRMPRRRKKRLVGSRHGARSRSPAQVDLQTVPAAGTVQDLRQQYLDAVPTECAWVRKPVKHGCDDNQDFQKWHELTVKKSEINGGKAIDHQSFLRTLEDQYNAHPETSPIDLSNFPALDLSYKSPNHAPSNQIRDQDEWVNELARPRVVTMKYFSYSKPVAYAF